MARKPTSIKAARKKKQEVVSYPKPEGDDWKPDGWQRMWDMVYQKLLPLMLEHIAQQQEQAA